jgi:TPR repeat protein
MTPEKIEAIYDDEEPSQARSLLLPEAERGNLVAQFYLGQLCAEENPRNDDGAVTWYRSSAAGGYVLGIHYLASHMYFGLGTPQDVQGALRLFRNAAEAGLDASQWKLGQHLLAESGTREEALKWLALAAAQGHQAAKELLSANSAA